MPYQPPKFIDEMTALRDAAAGRAADYGVPSVRSLILATRTAEGIRYERIAPDPVVELQRQSPEAIAAIGAVEGQVARYRVRGVSRRYARDTLETQATDYYLDGEIRGGELVGGVLCELAEPIQERTTTWDLILKRKIGEQRWHL